jgi:hypothetical protein
MTNPVVVEIQRLRDVLSQASRLLRLLAGDRQQASGKWTMQEQAAVDCATQLDTLLRRHGGEPPAPRYALAEIVQQCVACGRNRSLKDWEATCVCGSRQTVIVYVPPQAEARADTGARQTSDAEPRKCARCSHGFESHCNAACVQGCYECDCPVFEAGD